MVLQSHVDANEKGSEHRDYGNIIPQQNQAKLEWLPY